MPSPEIPLQHDLFTSALVDTRSARQKQADRIREHPQQAELFSQRVVAQFGVIAQPLVPLAPGMRLELAIEDHRTDEEMDAGAQSGQRG